MEKRTRLTATTRHSTLSRPKHILVSVTDMYTAFCFVFRAMVSPQKKGNAKRGTGERPAVLHVHLSVYKSNLLTAIRTLENTWTQPPHAGPTGKETGSRNTEIGVVVRAGGDYITHTQRERKEKRKCRNALHFAFHLQPCLVSSFSSTGVELSTSSMNRYQSDAAKCVLF